jgi:hypothetical protein
MVLIIEDLFTITSFAPLLLQHAHGAVWLHNQLCHFIWKWITRTSWDKTMIVSRRQALEPAALPDAWSVAPPTTGDLRIYARYAQGYRASGNQRLAIRTEGGKSAAYGPSSAESGHRAIGYGLCR